MGSLEQLKHGDKHMNYVNQVHNIAKAHISSVLEDVGKSLSCKTRTQCNKSPRMATSYLPVHQRLLSCPVT